MAKVYFHCSNARGVLRDRCGTSVSDLIEACETATSKGRCDRSSQQPALKIGVIGHCMSAMRPVM
jgi:hypothetical protein